MSLSTRLLALVHAIGADIKSISGTLSGLGTAATANLATSQYDTAVRAANMSLGFYGLGSKTLGNVTVTQLNSLDRSGFFSINSAIPNILDNGSKILHIEGSVSSATQLGFRLQTNRMYLRSRAGSNLTGTWTSWIEVFHAENLLNIGSSAPSARAAIQSSIMPAYTLATLPSAATNLNMIAVVTDLSSGREPCISDGVNWLKLSDRAVAA